MIREERHEKWWRAIALAAIAICILAGVVINRERATNRELAENIDRMESAILRAATEAGQIREGVGRLSGGIDRSVELVSGLAEGIVSAQRRTHAAIEYSSVLEDTIIYLSERGGDVDSALGELADEIRRTTGAGVGAGANGSSGD